VLRNGLHASGQFLKGRRYLSVLTILLVLLVVSGTNLNVKHWERPMRVIQWDIKSYYAYLPAAFIYQDLSLDFTREDPGFFHDKFWPLPTPTGGKCIVTSMGMSFLYLPFFVMGHLYAWLTGAEMSGYSPPYAMFLVFSALFYLGLGLFVLRKILLRYFPDWVVALTLLSVVLGTNLLWYATHEAPMSHAYSFAMYAVFMWLTIRWHDRPDAKTSIFLGLLSGLIVLVRPTNILVLLFFIFYGIDSRVSLKERIRLLLQHYPLILIMALAAILVWVPQMLYWKKVAGQWLYFSYGEDSAFYFGNPQIIKGLFSYRKGWLLYTPLMALALAGIYFLRRYARSFFWPVLIFTLLNTYVVLSWWSWWYGGGFGLRAFIEAYAFLTVPLAALIYACGSYGKRFRRWIIALILLLTLHGVFQTVQYYYLAIHWDGMTKTTYWSSFGRPRPLPGFFDMLERPDYLLARQGIQATEEKEVPEPETVYSISFDLENRTEDKMYYFSECGNYLISGGKAQSKKRAYEGDHSIRLNRRNPYGLTTHVNVKGGEHFRVSLMRRSAWFSGKLVVASEDSSELYKVVQLGPPSGKRGWDELSICVTIPELQSTNILIYAYNPSLLPAYFDNLLIERLKEGCD
jgi:hypothetical protein